MTHHRVSLSSPQTKDGSMMSPRAISLQMQNTIYGQSGCSWYPAAAEDQWLSDHHATTVHRVAIIVLFAPSCITFIFFPLFTHFKLPRH